MIHEVGMPARIAAQDEPARRRAMTAAAAAARALRPLG